MQNENFQVGGIKQQQPESKSDKTNRVEGSEDDHKRFQKELNELINGFINPSANKQINIQQTSEEGTEGSDKKIESDKKSFEKRVSAGLERSQGIIQTPAERIKSRDTTLRQKFRAQIASGKTNDAIKAGED